MINGMVQGEDGRKMSKSLGNIVAPDETLEKYGADATRQWAAYSMPGSDIPYAWKDVIYSHKFNLKLWNACRFAQGHLDNYKPKETKLTTADKAMLSKLSSLIKQIEEPWQKYEFQNVLTPIQQFFWHDVCDNYLEMIKYRLYNKEEVGKESYDAARYTLYTLIEACIKLLAPFMPHITEELYQNVIHKPEKSIHTSQWPALNFKDKKAEEALDLGVQVLAYLRKWKSDREMAMNSELSLINLFGPASLKKIKKDLAKTMKAKSVKIVDSKKGLKKISDDLYIKVTQ